MNQDNNLNMQQPMNQMPNQPMNMQQPMNQMPNQPMNMQQPMNQMPNQPMNMQQPMNQMPNQQMNMQQPMNQIPNQSMNMQQPMNQMPNQQMNMQQPMNQIPNQQMNMQQPMNQMPNQQMNMQQPMNQMSNQQTVLPKGVDNNALLEAYIGKNFNKFITKKFNFSGFFFTTTYMAYRGMYLHAVAYFIIANLIGFIIRFPALKLLSAIIVGTFVNKIYLMHVNKSIDKIKINNSGKNTEELKQICAKKGGRNFWIALVVCIIFSAISFNLPNPIDPIATIRIGDTEETESFDEDSNITITETQDA